MTLPEGRIVVESSPGVGGGNGKDDIVIGVGTEEGGGGGNSVDVVVP